MLFRMFWSAVGGAALTLAIMNLWSGRPHHASRAFARSPLKQTDAAEAALRQRVATLEDKIADQSHAMTDVAYHFSNLWFAAAAENWPLAEFYWKETHSHLKWAVRIIPIRKDSSNREIKLGEILQSIENTTWAQLGQAIEQRDVPKFQTAYRSTLEACYTCHKAAEKPYLRPHVPQRPGTHIINFDPTATWPK